MQRLFAAFVVACVTCVIGSTPGFARGTTPGIAHGSVGMGRAAGMRRGAHGPELQQMPTMQDRIPAPLAPPSQPPTINGPLQQSPPGLPPMGGAR
jgi:hypothetical protein